jgi:hypothetical protein
MPISYHDDDMTLYNSETGAAATRSVLAANADELKKYEDWWHRKRRDFHSELIDMVKSYRSDLKLYYYNWDSDKFGMVLPDLHSAKFFEGISKGAYLSDRYVRKNTTTDQYLQIMQSGDFSASLLKKSTEYGLRPSLYSNVHDVELLAPANILHLANNADYLNYFQTADGVAVSNCVSYDEIYMRCINPKYECNVTTPGGAAFSMAFELMSYFHADAKTLTYTVYTYGRGFANAHRRFAQAFLALPAIKGSVIENPDADVKIRAYNAAAESYVGVANKAYTAKTIMVKLPLPEEAANVTVKDLVTNVVVASTIVDGELQFEVNSGAMELNSFLIDTQLNLPSEIQSNNISATVSLFPNPVENILNIKLGENRTESIDISIINSLGKEMIRKTVESLDIINIDVSTLSKGAYICRIASEEHSANIKFVK